MKVQIRKNVTPEEISESGGASVVIVNKETVNLETSVEEAKDALIVVGDKLLIKGIFVGCFKSMIKGIERDGNARQLGDFLTLYPVPTGQFDLERGWDPAVNGVRVRARLMNEMEIDISNWEFEDVTPGRQPFAIESIEAGGVTGVVTTGEPIAINGRNLPVTAAIRVSWAVPELGLAGNVAAAKVTSTATRVDIAADALSQLGSTCDGKEIVFTLRGNFANAKTTATLKYVAPPVPTITKMRQQGMASDDLFSFGTAGFTITGTNLSLAAGDKVTIELWDGTTQLASNEATIASSSDTTIVNTAGCEDESGVQPVQWEEKSAKLVVTKGGTRIEHAIVVNA